MAVLKNLYFFDQPKRQYNKRQRKPLDQLPFSLPFTGVSGTLKVEAYLKQQMKISAQTPTTTKDNTSPVVGTSPDSDPTVKKDHTKDPSNSPPLIQGKTNDSQDTGKKPRSKEKLGTSESLNLGVRECDDEEEEDTQRFLFEENKFAAPNLLARLTRILEWLEEQQQNRAEENNQGTNNWATLTTSDKANVGLISLGASFSDVRALNIPIPFHLQEKLKWDFDQLIAHTVYHKREWQTTSYKQQAVAESQQVQEQPEATPPANTPSPNTKNNLTKVDEPSASRRSRKERQSISEGSPNLLKKEPTMDNKDIIITGPDIANVNVVSVRRESKDYSYNQPRTRLEKYKVLPDKQLLVPIERKRKTGLNSGRQDDLLDTHSQLQPEASFMQFPVSSIAFSLMSKQCEEKGWVMHNDADIERLTLIEWAIKRLQEAKIKSDPTVQTGPVLVKKYGEKKEKKADKTLPVTKYMERTSDKPVPVVFKQYGEVTSGKAKRGKSKIRRTASGKAKLELFLVAVPDGTMTVYYPSGKIAVCVSNNLVGEGKYTYVYDNNSQDSLLAYFTPTNGFCCDRGGKKILCDPKGGVLYNQDGALLRKWIWKAGKILPSIHVELNEYLSLRIVSHNVITLQYNGHQESHKLTFGISQDARSILTNAKGEVKTISGHIFDVSQTVFDQKPTTKQNKSRTKNKKEDKKTRRPSVHVETDELQETRQEELNRKFPERNNLALDLPSDIELYKLKRRIRHIAFEWMEKYRLLVGISSPIKITTKHARRKQTSSARSLPGALPSSQSASLKLDQIAPSPDQRAPSAPPMPRSVKIDVGKVTPLGKLTGLAENYKERGAEWLRKDNASVSPVYLTEVDKHKLISGSTSPRPPFRCGLANQEPRCTSPKDGCPVALRSEMLGEKYVFCRCKKREIPFVHDLEYDAFVREQVPHSQLLVVSIVSSSFPDDALGINMLERLYYEKNRNRSFPCAQARHDPFRIVLYDVDNATDQDEAMLVRRHNVVPGMFLMYIGGKLLFADHIFNGYGNERNDFLKQITKCRKDFIQGLFLPQNFRLSPTPCRSGLRAAWGGEIGGLSKSVCRTDTRFSDQSGDGTRLPSAVTSLSSESNDYRASGAKSAASFIKLGLSIDSPFGRGVKSKTAPIRKFPRN